MFYDLFCTLCKEKGISPTRATIEIGLSRTIGTKWKKTAATPQGETLQKIADYFGVSVDYLLGNTDEKKESAPVSQGGHSKTALAFAEEFKDFGPEEWKKVREYAELLKSAHNKKGSE